MAIALAAACATPSLAQDYTVTTAPLGFTSISATGTDIGASFGDPDSGSFNIAVPFDFQFFGTSIVAGTNMMRVSANGVVSFNATASISNTSSSLSSTSAPANSIFLAWDDLDFSASGSIFTEVQGTAPNRVFVIEYNMVPGFSTITTLADGQIVIEETTNIVRLRYSASTVFSAGSVTSGLKSPGTVNLVRGLPSTNRGQPTPTSNIVFTPSAGEVDLRLTTQTLTPANRIVQPNDSITVGVTIQNVGAMNSTNFGVSVYLSIDDTIDSNDQLIGSLSTNLQLNGLTASMTLSSTFSLPTPNPVSTGRNYYIGVIADPAGSQNESFLNDNTSFIPIATGTAPFAYTVTTQPQTAFASIFGNPNTVTVFNGGTMGDLDDAEFELLGGVPFAFTYFGNSIQAGAAVNVSTNGFVEIAQGLPSATSAFSNVVLPSTGIPNGILAPFWDDFRPGTNATNPGMMLSNVSGTAPNRRWTVEFKDITRFGSGMFNFQAIVEETTNVIRYIYATNTSTSLSGTIGLDDLAGVDGISLNVTGVMTMTSNVTSLPTVDIIFTPPGAMPPAAVDLTPTAISVAQASANAATMIDVTRTVMNAGTSAAMMPFQVSIYLSTDSTITTADTLLGTDTIASLGAGMSATATSSFLIPTATAAGNYFVGIIVNTGQAPITESNSMNNSLATTGTVMISVPGKAQGNINGDNSIDIADVMACITVALATDSNSPANIALADVNGDNDVNILDIQITVNRVLAAP